VEADTIVKTNFVQQQTAPAGLVRLSHAIDGGTGYVYDNSSEVEPQYMSLILEFG
jgi:hypothetical protein